MSTLTKNIVTAILPLVAFFAFGNAAQQEALPQAQAEASSVITAEEYLVLSALINQKHLEPTAKRMFTLEGELIKERFLIDEVKLVVIESNTLPNFDYKVMDLPNLRHALSSKMPLVVEATFQDFIDKNRQSYDLSNKFSSKVRTTVIGQQERQSYIHTETGRLDKFFARFPGSQGTLAFSRVGFNLSKDKALAYVEARQDFTANFTPLWTWDTYFALLAKEKDGWIIQHVYYPNRPDPESAKRRSLTVDLSQCSPVSRHVAWGLGSAHVEIKGRQGGKCILHHFSELEGGYSQSECRVPVSFKELTIHEGGTTFYYSRDLSKHCKVIKMGNIFLRE
jgi:hypothetical protein